MTLNGAFGPKTEFESIKFSKTFLLCPKNRKIILNFRTLKSIFGINARAIFRRNTVLTAYVNDLYVDQLALRCRTNYQLAGNVSKSELQCLAKNKLIVYLP